MVHTALQQALAQCGIAASAIESASVGIGGYDWPAQHADHVRALAAAGLTMPVEIVNDAVVGLVGGAASGWGHSSAAHRGLFNFLVTKFSQHH